MSRNSRGTRYDGVHQQSIVRRRGSRNEPSGRLLRNDGRPMETKKPRFFKKLGLIFKRKDASPSVSVASTLSEGWDDTLSDEDEYYLDSVGAAGTCSDAIVKGIREAGEEISMGLRLTSWKFADGVHELKEELRQDAFSAVELFLRWSIIGVWAIAGLTAAFLYLGFKFVPQVSLTEAMVVIGGIVGGFIGVSTLTLHSLITMTKSAAAPKKISEEKQQQRKRWEELARKREKIYDLRLEVLELEERERLRQGRAVERKAAKKEAAKKKSKQGKRRVTQA